MTKLYELTGEEADELYDIVDSDDALQTRLRNVAEFVSRYMDKHNIPDSEAEEVCQSFRIYEIVRTGHRMGLSRVLDELSDFAELMEYQSKKIVGNTRKITSLFLQGVLKKAGCGFERSELR